MKELQDDRHVRVKPFAIPKKELHAISTPDLKQACAGFFIQSARGYAYHDY